MEVAAFVCPLDEFGLQELGRALVNFGHIEYLLDGAIFTLAKLDDPTMRKELVSPLATRKKLDVINKNLEKMTNAEARKLLVEACRLIGKVNDARNDVLHGFWAFNSGAGVSGNPVSRTPKKPGKTANAADISRIADEAAIATRLLFTAILTNLDVEVRVPPFPVPLWSGDGAAQGPGG